MSVCNGMKIQPALFLLLVFLFQVVLAMETARIEEITGLKGSLDEKAGVFKVTSSRNDIAVTVDGKTLDPFLGLTSWAAFTLGKEAETMVMGDLVLFQDEVNPVMSAALENGLTVTALHNHFFSTFGEKGKPLN